MSTHRRESIEEAVDTARGHRSWPRYLTVDGNEKVAAGTGREKGHGQAFEFKEAAGAEGATG